MLDTRPDKKLWIEDHISPLESILPLRFNRSYDAQYRYWENEYNKKFNNKEDK